MSNSLKKLLNEFRYLEQNSTKVKEDSIFLAYPGDINDGRDFIDEAIKKGASAIIYDPLDFKWNDRWNVKNFPLKNLKNTP